MAVIGFEFQDAFVLEDGLAEVVLTGEEFAEADAKAWFIDGTVGGEERVQGPVFRADLMIDRFGEVDAGGVIALERRVVFEVDLGHEVVGIQPDGQVEEPASLLELIEFLEFDAPIIEAPRVPPADGAGAGDAARDQARQGFEPGDDLVPERGVLVLNFLGERRWGEGIGGERGEGIGQAGGLEIDAFEEVAEAGVEIVGGVGGDHGLELEDEHAGIEDREGGDILGEVVPAIGKDAVE